MNETSQPKRLLRSRDDRFIGGVAAGVANYFSIDPTLVRLVFALSLLLGGIGPIAYLVLLVSMPVEGPADEPLPPIPGSRRNVVIAAAVLFAIFAVPGIGSDGFLGWTIGLTTESPVGILAWVVGLAAVIWLAMKGRASREATAKAPPLAGDQVQVAAAPTQNAPTTPQPPGGPDQGKDTDITSVLPGTGSDSTTTDSGAGTTVGRVMTVIAVGITALIGFSILAVLSTWITAQFGSVPMALLVIALGAGLVIAGVKGRPGLSLWLLAAALTIAVPMAVVTLAGLRIDGSYGVSREAPARLSDIPDGGYSMAAGRKIVDLRKLPFRDNSTLDLTVNSGLGLTSVIVPDRVCVAAEVTGVAGAAWIRGREISGVGLDWGVHPPRSSAPRIELTTDFKLGMVEILDSTGWKATGGLDGDRFHRTSGAVPPSRAGWIASRKRARLACLTEPAPRAKGNRH